MNLFKRKFGRLVKNILIQASPNYLSYYNHNLPLKGLLKCYPKIARQMISEKFSLNRPDMTISFLDKILKKYGAARVYLSEIVTPDFVEAHPQIGWSIYLLAKNHRFSRELLERLNERYWGDFYPYMVDFDEKFFRENIKKFLVKHDNVLLNKGLSIDFILRNQDILPLPRKLWRKDIEIRHLLEYPDYPWDWEMLTISTPYEQIIQHTQLPWCWDFMIKNHTVPLELFESMKNNYRPQTYFDGFNANLTFKFIRKYLNEYRTYGIYLDRNDFTAQREMSRQVFNSELKINKLVSLYF